MNADGRLAKSPGNRGRLSNDVYYLVQKSSDHKTNRVGRLLDDNPRQKFYGTHNCVLCLCMGILAVACRFWVDLTHQQGNGSSQTPTGTVATNGQGFGSPPKASA